MYVFISHEKNISKEFASRMNEKRGRRKCDEIAPESPPQLMTFAATNENLARVNICRPAGVYGSCIYILYIYI